jgi:hypothetical protein
MEIIPGKFPGIAAFLGIDILDLMLRIRNRFQPEEN